MAIFDVIKLENGNIRLLQKDSYLNATFGNDIHVIDLTKTQYKKLVAHVKHLLDNCLDGGVTIGRGLTVCTYIGTTEHYLIHQVKSKGIYEQILLGNPQYTHDWEQVVIKLENV